MRASPTWVFLSIWCLFMSAPAWADQEVLDVALAPAIQNRQPVNPFTPPARCEKDNNTQSAVPVLDVSVTEKVYFWTRLSSSTKGRIRHSWHQEVNGQWKNLSNVELRIRPSASFRTWSFKTLLPRHHVGNWMIVVAPSDNPTHILCISRFIVK